MLVKQSIDKTLGSVDREVIKFGSPLSTSCGAHVSTCLISDDISLVQDFIMDLRSSGTRDRVSASPLALPGGYFILKLKSTSSLTQRKPNALTIIRMLAGYCRCTRQKKAHNTDSPKVVHTLLILTLGTLAFLNADGNFFLHVSMYMIHKQ